MLLVTTPSKYHPDFPANQMNGQLERMQNEMEKNSGINFYEFASKYFQAMIISERIRDDVISKAKVYWVAVGESARLDLSGNVFIPVSFKDKCNERCLIGLLTHEAIHVFSRFNDGFLVKKIVGQAMKAADRNDNKHLSEFTREFVDEYLRRDKPGYIIDLLSICILQGDPLSQSAYIDLIAELEKTLGESGKYAQTRAGLLGLLRNYLSQGGDAEVVLNAVVALSFSLSNQTASQNAVLSAFSSKLKNPKQQQAFFAYFEYLGQYGMRDVLEMQQKVTNWIVNNGGR